MLKEKQAEDKHQKELDKEHTKKIKDEIENDPVDQE